MMAAFGTEPVEPPKTVLVVADDPAIRSYVRNSVIDESRYVLDCSLADLRTMTRSVRFDAVLVIGERTGLMIATLREALAAARVPTRRVLVVSHASEARAALDHAFD